MKRTEGNDVLNFQIGLLNFDPTVLEVLCCEESTKEFLGNCFSGEFEKNIDHPILSFSEPCEDPFEVVKTRVVKFLENADDEKKLTLMAVMVSLLQVFVRENYTGPQRKEVQQYPYKGLVGDVFEKHDPVEELCIDGEVFYHQCSVPSYLHCSRLMFYESEPYYSSETFPTFFLWMARLNRIHQEHLSYRSHTLESRTLSIFKDILVPRFGDENDNLSSMIHLEHGLSLSLFGKVEESSGCYEKSKHCSGIFTNLTGKLGVRTKYQVYEHAQMILEARSKRTPKEDSTILTDTSESRKKEIPLEKDSILLERIKLKGNKNEDDEEESLTKEEDFLITGPLELMDQCLLLAQSEDVRRRNPKSGGLVAEETLPFVTRVIEASRKRKEGEEDDEYFRPHNWMIFSHALLLKSRIEHEKLRTIERSVLQLDELRLQFERDEEPSTVHRLRYFYCLAFPAVHYLRKELADRYCEVGMFRSGLEIYQVLGMTRKVIECYIILEKEERAKMMIRDELGLVTTESLFDGYGEEEEEGEEQKKTTKKKKEKKNLSSQQQAVLYNLLGGLEDDKDMFIKSWEISGHKYARSMRDLGKWYAKRSEWEACIEPLEKSLQMNAIYNQVWFLLGCSCIRLKRWKRAKEAFTRVVQLAPQDGEAWTNLASVYHTLKDFRKAWSSLKMALKVREREDRIWYNFLVLSIQIGEFLEAMQAMDRLIVIGKGKHEFVDYQILGCFVKEYEKRKLKYEEEEAKNIGEEEQEQEGEEQDGGLKERKDELRFWKRRINQLLDRVISKLTPPLVFWDIKSVFHEVCEEYQDSVRTRQQHLRHTMIEGWEKKTEEFEEVVKSLEILFTDSMKVKEVEVRKRFIEAVKMEAQSIFERSEACFKEHQRRKDVKKVEVECSKYL